MRFPRMDHEEIRAALGLAPKAKLPRAGIKIIEIEGWKVWVDYLGFRYQIRRHSHFKPHRAMAQCPRCGKIISAGRISQHAKVHPED
jgi:hypothetical protein